MERKVAETLKFRRKEEGKEKDETKEREKILKEMSKGMERKEKKEMRERNGIECSGMQGKKESV